MATRNPSLNIRPDVAKGAGVKKGVQTCAESDAEEYLIGPRPPSWYTGKHPIDCPGYSAKDNALRALPLPCTSNFTRQGLLDYFDNSWTQTEVCFVCLCVSVCVCSPVCRCERVCVRACVVCL